MTSTQRPRRAGGASCIVACVLIAAIACNDSTASQPAQLTTQISPTQIFIGDTMRVVTTVYITGRGHAMVESHTCDSPFEVLDASGNVVGPGSDRACQPVGAPVDVPGGGSYPLQGFWTGLSKESRPGNPRYLPAGTYQVRGIATVLGLSSPIRGTLLTVTLQQR